jgi:membrane protein YdbS with pleckstrin-like domain
MDEIVREPAEDESAPEPLPQPIVEAGPVSVEAQPAVARQVDPRYVRLQRTVGWIATAILSFSLLAAGGIGWLTTQRPQGLGAWLLPAWLLVTIALAWLLQVWPAVQYRHTSYTVGPEGIEIQSGVWWRHLMSVPRSRVQHIDVSQGPMERSYGLGRLVIFTAGTEHSRVELPGLKDSVAYDLRNHLLPRGSDDAV